MLNFCFCWRTKKKNWRREKDFNTFCIWLTRELVQASRLKNNYYFTRKRHLSQREQNNTFIFMNNTLSRFMNSFTATVLPPRRPRESRTLFPDKMIKSWSKLISSSVLKVIHENQRTGSSTFTPLMSRSSLRDSFSCL